MCKKELDPGKSTYSSAENGRSTFRSPQRHRSQFRLRRIRAGLRCYWIRLIAHPAAFALSLSQLMMPGWMPCRLLPYAVVAVKSAKAWNTPAALQYNVDVEEFQPC